MKKQDKIEPLTTCRNPAGCTNACEPGYNFCDSCREFYGMKQHEEERKKSLTPITGKYRHKIIGVGDAAQTHLTNVSPMVEKAKKELRKLDKEIEPMDTKHDNGPTEEPKSGGICGIHGKHSGKMIGNNYNPDICPQCEAVKKRQSLLRHGAATSKTGIMFEGLRKEFVERQAKEAGLSIKQLLTIWIDERIPAEEYKAGVMADKKRGM